MGVTAGETAIFKDVDTTKTTHISLCSGYGGIDLGLRRIIPNLRTVAYAEIEAFAIECLLARMEGGQLDAAPIWSDLKSFPWADFSGLVDILSGGYPCQPFSAVGKRAGKNDPRHLWPWIADGISIMRPRVCFFENVEGHISLGLSSVVSDLEEMGYSVSWGIFSAAETNFPHRRKRLFLLANSISKGLEGHSWNVEGARGQNTWESGSTCEGSLFRDFPAQRGNRQHKWEPPRVIIPSKSKVCGNSDGNPSGLDNAIVYAADCQPCECCDDVICWKCGGHYADCPCPRPNSDDN
jgi:site-specific DNA-cytosine methylase